MNILITGANGFIGKNLSVQLSTKKEHKIIKHVRTNTLSELEDKIRQSDFIFHLAGENRPNDITLFDRNNAQLTESIAAILSKINLEENKKIPLIFASSLQATLNNPYGLSKKRAEDHLLKLKKDKHFPIYIFRLPNVFGKWSKPNYNSAIASFCYNVARGLPISVDNPDAEISLLYIDDLVSQFLNILEFSDSSAIDNKDFYSISNIYETSVGEIAKKIINFNLLRAKLMVDNIGLGLDRALYATYISFLPTSNFSYSLKNYNDERGSFVEMLKTTSSGQISFFTAKPGITRGGHFHHTKTEKFLVLLGKARFIFKCLDSQKEIVITTDGSSPEIVDTIPGWAHNITNIGDDDLVVLLWANEIFDPEKPDTFQYPLEVIK